MCLVRVNSVACPIDSLLPVWGKSVGWVKPHNKVYILWGAVVLL